MDFATELAYFNVDPALAVWLVEPVSERGAALEAQAMPQKRLRAQVQAKEAEIESKNKEARNKGQEQHKKISRSRG